MRPRRTAAAAWPGRSCARWERPTATTASSTSATKTSGRAPPATCVGSAPKAGAAGAPLIVGKRKRPSKPWPSTLPRGPTGAACAAAWSSTPSGPSNSGAARGALLTRGRRQVQAELSLSALAYNLTRSLAVMGAAELLKRLRERAANVGKQPKNTLGRTSPQRRRFRCRLRARRALRTSFWRSFPLPR